VTAISGTDGTDSCSESPSDSCSNDSERDESEEDEFCPQDEWYPTEDDLPWLATPEGREFLFNYGSEWLESDAGCEWLDTRDGARYLGFEEERLRSGNEQQDEPERELTEHTCSKCSTKYRSRYVGNRPLCRRCLNQN